MTPLESGSMENRECKEAERAIRQRTGWVCRSVASLCIHGKKLAAFVAIHIYGLDVVDQFGHPVGHLGVYSRGINACSIRRIRQVEQSSRQVCAVARQFEWSGEVIRFTQ